MLNVALIGIGNIGLLFDHEKDDSSKAFSHTKAIYMHKEFTLKYAVDINDAHFKELQNFFPSVELYTDYKKILKFEDIDVLVIAAPTIKHFEILHNFKDNTNIKLFFMEKPLFLKDDEYKMISTNIREKIVVNYLRRFDKEIQHLKNNIKTNMYKSIDKIIINYCKGLINNGSHMIDLINFLFDNPKIISSVILNEELGLNESDLTYDLFIKFQYKNLTIPLYFIGVKHINYNIIEANFYCQNRVIKYINSENSIKYYSIIKDKNFPTYNVVSTKPIIKKIDYKFLMLYAYNELYNMIKTNAHNISSYKDEINNRNFLSFILKEKK